MQSPVSRHLPRPWRVLVIAFTHPSLANTLSRQTASTAHHQTITLGLTFCLGSVIGLFQTMAAPTVHILESGPDAGDGNDNLTIVYKNFLACNKQYFYTTRISVRAADQDCRLRAAARVGAGRAGGARGAGQGGVPHGEL